MNGQETANPIGLSDEAEEETQASAVDAEDERPDWRSSPVDDSPDLTGEIGEVEDLDPSQPDRRPTPAGPVGELLNAGHGFTIVTMASGRTVGMQPLRDCIVCGSTVLNRADRWWCEFSGLVEERPLFEGLEGNQGGFRTRPRMTHCRCNACIWNQDRRTSGRPAEVCSEPCRLERERRKKAAEREAAYEADRALAREWIADYPDMTVGEIATQAGIRPKRVKEALGLIPV